MANVSNKELMDLYKKVFYFSLSKYGRCSARKSEELSRIQSQISEYVILGMGKIKRACKINKIHLKKEINILSIVQESRKKIVFKSL